MEIIRTCPISLLQKEGIFRLWNAAYPSGIAYDHIQQLDDYLNGLTEKAHYFLMDGATIAGWAITFTRAAETWFAIILDNTYHGKGLGALLMEQLQKDNAVLNGWVVAEGHYSKRDGTAYNTPLPFYRKLGFDLLNECLEIPQMKTVKIRWVRQ